MLIPENLSGFRAAVGVEIPNDHFLARAITQQAEFAEWLDRRYERVFTSPRFVAPCERLARLRHDLSRVEGFEAADAEVQAAATMLLTPELRVLAEAEKARAADYVAILGREVDVEVRVLNESADKQEVKRIGRSIVVRLERALGIPGLQVALQVRRVRNGENDLVLNGKIEKRLVRTVRELAASNAWHSGPRFVTLGPDGVAQIVTRRSDRSVELASVELRLKAEWPRPLVVNYSGLEPLPERKRTSCALKKKIGRKQRSGDRPWVIVLDTTDSTLLDLNEIRAGAEEQFSSTSLSAVAIQRWSLGTAGWGVSAEDQYVAGYYSVVLANRKARYPLTPQELDVFCSVDRVEVNA